MAQGQHPDQHFARHLKEYKPQVTDEDMQQAWEQVEGRLPEMAGTSGSAARGEGTSGQALGWSMSGLKTAVVLAGLSGMVWMAVQFIQPEQQNAPVEADSTISEEAPAQEAKKATGISAPSIQREAPNRIGHSSALDTTSAREPKAHSPGQRHRKGGASSSGLSQRPTTVTQDVPASSAGPPSARQQKAPRKPGGRSQGGPEVQLSLNSAVLCEGSICKGVLDSRQSQETIFELSASTGNVLMLEAGDSFGLRIDTPGVHELRLTAEGHQVDFARLEVLARPRAQFSARVSEEGDLLLQNETTHAHAYQWNMAGEERSGYQPAYRFRDTGAYVIRLTAFQADLPACRDTTEKTVRYDPQPFKYPNVITPNGDGPNDQLQLQMPAGYQLISLKVYDREGRLVAHQQGAGASWDGHYRNGQPCPSGRYHYVIRYRDAQGAVVNPDPVGLTLVR